MNLRALMIYTAYMNKVLNIKTRIELVTGDVGVMTSYTDGTTIFVSEEWLESLEDELEILVMCMHEGFHAYQLKCIREKSLPEEILNQWQSEFESYVNPNQSIDGHWKQKVEQTAVIFSDIALNAMSGGLHLSDKIRNMFNPEDVEFVKSLNFNFD